MGTLTPVYGIINTLENANVLSEDFDDAAQFYDVRDQANALIKKVKYDTVHTLTLSVEVGTTKPSVTAGETFSYGTKTWFAESVKKTGSFSDKTKWSITATRLED